MFATLSNRQNLATTNVIYQVFSLGYALLFFVIWVFLSFQPAIQKALLRAPWQG